MAQNQPNDDIFQFSYPADNHILQFVAMEKISNFMGAQSICLDKFIALILTKQNPIAFPYNEVSELFI